jgi:predicted membrane protein (TIGR00267 family)
LREARILESEGVKAEDARVIAKRLQANPDAFTQTMVQKELGLEVEPRTARLRESLTMGLSYGAASIVPLFSYFFLPLHKAFVASIAMTILVLGVIGVIRGSMAKMNLFISTLEVVGVGAVSGLGGYFLGMFVPRLFGY